MALFGSMASGLGMAAMATNPMGWIAGGASLLAGIIGGIGQQNQANEMLSSINEQEKALKKQQESVGLAAQAKTDITLGQAYEAQEGLGFDTSGAFESIYRKGESLAAMTGLVDESRMQPARQQAQRGYEIKAQGLESQLGSSLAEIDMWKESEGSRIEEQMRLLGQQRSMYEQQTGPGAFLFG